MEFRTPIIVTPSPIRIDHRTPILTLGSCFANVMGKKLAESKIPVSINPFGVVFNPVSIFKILQAAIENKNLFEESYVEVNNIWHNYDLHSELSHTQKGTLSDLIADKIKVTHHYLENTRLITLTFGTAFVYRLKSSEKIVANCHKIPSQQFRKELLSTEEIIKNFEKIYKLLKNQFPSIQIIVTVSPVRHLKDGMEENSISKSILRVACHQIQKTFQNVEYFPSFEIIMDDLRDYRFYSKDMVHPNEVAEEYIWEKFQEKYMEEITRNLMTEWYSVQKALSHKPFHPTSSAHQKFLKETYNRLEKLSSFMDVKDEIEMLRATIENLP